MSGNPYRSLGTGGGHVRGFGTEPPARNRGRMGGVIVAGCVVATYVQIDGEVARPDAVSRISAVYCDVLTYGSAPGLNGGVLTRVLVANSTGLHDGHIWKPRAARIDVSGTFTPETADPRNLDGDHVLVQFLEDDVMKPIITSRLPHPRTGIGNDGLPDVGNRERLQLADGEPSLWKQNGSFFGVDGSGNFQINTVRAHDGEYDEDGTETPKSDSAHGKAVIRLPKTASLKVTGEAADDDEDVTFLISVQDGLISLALDDASTRLDIEDKKVTATIDNGAGGSIVLEKAISGANTLTVNLGAGGADGQLIFEKPDAGEQKLTVKFGADSFVVKNGGAATEVIVGAGPKSATIFEALKTAWDAVMAAISGHTHTVDLSTTVGNLGYPVAGTATATASLALATITTTPPIDAAKCSKLKIPDVG